MINRDDVVKEAMTWLGTPYHGHARIKGVGVDCAQLPAAVYAACGLIDDFDPSYDEQWHLHREEELYLKFVFERAKEINLDEAESGDFLIWRFGRTFSHGGIMIDNCRVIHAQIEMGVIIDDITQNSELINRPRRAFTLFG